MKRAEDSKLSAQAVGRIIGLQPNTGEGPQKQSCGTCFFVRGPDGRTLGVTAAHVLEDTERIKIAVVANAAGSRYERRFDIHPDQILFRPAPGDPDVHLFEASALEPLLLENGFGRAPLHIELAAMSEPTPVVEYHCCSFVKDGEFIEATVLIGERGICLIEGEAPATLAITGPGDHVIIGSPPRGASGSPVWAIDDQGSTRFVGMLTSRVEDPSEPALNERVGFVLPEVRIFEILSSVL